MYASWLLYGLLLLVATVLSDDVKVAFHSHRGREKNGWYLAKTDTDTGMKYEAKIERGGSISYSDYASASTARGFMTPPDGARGAWTWQKPDGDAASATTLPNERGVNDRLGALSAHATFDVRNPSTSDTPAAWIPVGRIATSPPRVHYTPDGWYFIWRGTQAKIPIDPDSDNGIHYFKPGASKDEGFICPRRGVLLDQPSWTIQEPGKSEDEIESLQRPLPSGAPQVQVNAKLKDLQEEGYEFEVFKRDSVWEEREAVKPEKLTISMESVMEDQKCRGKQRACVYPTADGQAMIFRVDDGTQRVEVDSEITIPKSKVVPFHLYSKKKLEWMQGTKPLTSYGVSDRLDRLATREGGCSFTVTPDGQTFTTMPIVGKSRERRGIVVTRKRGRGALPRIRQSKTKEAKETVATSASGSEAHHDYQNRFMYDLDYGYGAYDDFDYNDKEAYLRDHYQENAFNSLDDALSFAERSHDRPLIGDEYNDISGSGSSLLIGGVVGASAVVIIVLIFCLGLAFGMLIYWGYSKKKALEVNWKEQMHWIDDDDNNEA